MTGDEILDILDDAVAFLIKANPGVIAFNPRRSINKARVTQTNIRSATFEIGTYELDQNCDVEFDDAEAMIPIVALFHEVCGHGGQIKYEFDKNCNLSKVLGLNYYACKGSGAYYDGNTPDKFTKQYARQPHEIAAQYMAIKSARTYLSRIWGREKTDDMLLKYVNYRMNQNSEFVKRSKPYDDIDVVLKDFDDAFQSVVHVHRRYSLCKGRKSRDCFTTYLDDKQMSYGIGIMVVMCSDGVKQDYVMAAAFHNDYLKNEPSLKGKQLFQRKVFDGIDLEIDKAIATFQTFELSDKQGYISALDTLTNMAKEIEAGEGEGEDNHDDYDYP